LADRVARIRIFRQEQPFRDGPYVCSGNRIAHGFTSTIIAIEADDGTTGWGEMAPLGAFYSEAFPEAVLAGVVALAPSLVGGDARRPMAARRRLDALMMGQPAVKSAVDMALWDLAARLSGLPLADYLGGRDGDAVPLYRSISQDTPERMAKRALKYVEEGYRRLQIKVGGDPVEDVARVRAVMDSVPADIVLFADANGGWTLEAARRFMLGIGDLPIAIEQPCLRYDDCARLRAHCRQPLILDESIVALDDLLRASADGTADGVTIKISRVGGIGPARLLRDVAVGLGLTVTVEDTGGAEIDTAAMAQLSLSTPASHRQHTVDFHNWTSVGHADGMPSTAGGVLRLPEGPGLGIAVRERDLGPPIATFD
jgi:L-alanine-DL-glutamate epimerase-like enolase superfamily enzyme